MQCSTCGKIKTMYNKLSNFKTATWLNLIMPIQSCVLKTTENVNVVIYFVSNPLNIPPSTFCDLVKVMSFSCGYLIAFHWEAVEQTNQQRKKERKKQEQKRKRPKIPRVTTWCLDQSALGIRARTAEMGQERRTCCFNASIWTHQITIMMMKGKLAQRESKSRLKHGFLT